MVVKFETNLPSDVAVTEFLLVIPNFRAIHILLSVMRLKAVTSNALNRHKRHLFSV